MNKYDQGAKNKVREMMLGNAISALTVARQESELIARDELRITFDHYLDLIQAALKTNDFRIPAEVELLKWMEFDSCSNVSRSAGELKVLYLCGPFPVNDLRVLLSCGINIHNVWAITSSGQDSRSAYEQLIEFDLSLKIHEGPLTEFFEFYNEVFDLIYFDACGPFMGGKPNTLGPLLTIFEKQRLAQKGALITNYSSPPDDGSARQRYVQLATAYFHARYNDIPEIIWSSGLDPAIFMMIPDSLMDVIAEKLETVYSDLVTGLTIDLATAVVPHLRAFSMPSFLKRHANTPSMVGSIIKRQMDKESSGECISGDRWLSPISYPILSFIDVLEEYNSNDPLLIALRSYNRQGLSFKHFISVSELAKSVLEGNWDILSSELLSALKCSWFDYDARITCDIPLPNLLVNALVGIYGRPHFYNPRQSLRVKYTSNVREMFCDLFVFEQCRSFFDWFPTVQACPSRFKSVPFQIVARCLIDRLGWANFYNTANPFRGAAIGGIGETSVAKPLAIPERVSVN